MREAYIEHEWEKWKCIQNFSRKPEKKTKNIGKT